MRIYMPVTGITTPPVYGNIISNTTNTITVDQWWTVGDVAGPTPSGGNGLIIAPGGASALRFVALSNNASAPVATDTTLAGEITTNTLTRSLCTYNHAFGSNQLTLMHTWTAGGTMSGIHKAGAFTAQAPTGLAGVDPMIYESVLNQDANLSLNDTLNLTWQFTLSG
jgi:hypothetical protein